MKPDPDRFSRDTTIEVDFDKRTLDVVDRFAALQGIDRREALHTLIGYGWTVEAQAQREHPDWAWVFPDVDRDDHVAARRAVEQPDRLAARWRVDPELAEAAVAVWRLPHRAWACTVATRPDPAGDERWQVMLAAEFDQAAWLGGQAIAPLTYELAPRATGPIWTIAEGGRVGETHWSGYLDAAELGEVVTVPPVVSGPPRSSR